MVILNLTKVYIQWIYVHVHIYMYMCTCTCTIDLPGGDVERIRGLVGVTGVATLTEPLVVWPVGLEVELERSLSLIFDYKVNK